MVVNERALSVAKARYEIYNGERGSLRAKMKAIKAATGGQYGRSSAQYAEVRGINV